MSGRSNHVWGGLVFLAVCVLISVVIYTSATRDAPMTAKRPDDAGARFMEAESTALPDRALTSNDAGGFPDEMKSESGSPTTAIETRPVAADATSTCEGYWLGDHFAVSLITTGDGSTASLWRDEKTRWANPLSAEVARELGGGVAGTFDDTHLLVSFANIASIGMTCDANRAEDSEGGSMTRVGQAFFERITGGWPR